MKKSHSDEEEVSLPEEDAQALEESVGAEEELSFETEEELANPAALAKKLRERLATCEREKQEYLDGWQRAKADFVNARREEEQSRATLRKYAKVDLVSEILPIADNFERAMGNSEAWEKVDKNWRTGVEYIYTQLKQVLANHDVQELGKVGERFDARLHQPMETIATDDTAQDDTIVAVLEKGYTLHDHLVRPAKVTVAHYEENEREAA